TALAASPAVRPVLRVSRSDFHRPARCVRRTGCSQSQPAGSTAWPQTWPVRTTIRQNEIALPMSKPLMTTRGLPADRFVVVTTGFAVDPSLPLDCGIKLRRQSEVDP